MTNTKIELSNIEFRVLEILGEATDSWGERCISFAYIAGEENAPSLKEIGKACRALRAHGLAEFYRGLMTEEGEVAGSGYCISQEGKLFLNPCIDCHVRVSDMVDGRCQNCWENRPCIKCGKAYKDHITDWSKGGYKVEFEFPEEDEKEIA